MANKLTKTAATSAWDAGGNSLGIQQGDLFVSFALVKGSIGIVAGLAPAGGAPAYGAVEHGVLARAGQPIQIIESGAVVASTGVVFEDDVQVSVYRLGAEIYYVVGSFYYQSPKPSSGSKSLQAVLFSSGDAIDNPAIDIYAPDIANAYLVDTIRFTDAGGADPSIYAGLVDSFELTTFASADTDIYAGMVDFLTVLDAGGAQMVIMAGLQSSVSLSSGAGAQNESLLQYATNIATGAVTRYDGFGFHGFCRIGMDTYGFKTDGLYKIGGERDQGASIPALVDLAAEDFDTPQGKRVGNIFMGLSTDGDVDVRTIEDGGQEMNYRGYQRRAEWRADFARGRASRFWRLRLEVIDATHAQLDNIEWVVAPTGRRS